MKSNALVFLFMIISTIGFTQNQEERLLYIVDSIPIIDEPKEGFGILTENDIDRVEVVKDRKAIASATEYKDIDGIVYVFTKAYIQRPDSIKVIPTTNLMTKKNGVWYLKNSSAPYSGKFIDYYLNGTKQGEGTLFNGRLKGKRLMFHLNGIISDEVEYENGLPHGMEKRFYQDGTLMQKGEFENGKEVGVWEMYHPNGQLKQRSTFNKYGKMEGESVSYYSTGKLKGKNVYKNGVYQKDKINDKLFELYNESQDLYRQGNSKGALKKLNKALELSPNWADGYFARGTMKLNDFQFDEALQNLSKTLEIEPYFTNAYANRAFALIRKYEFGNSRTLSKSKGVQVLATKGTEIPKSDLAKICADLKKAVELGDDNYMVFDAIENFCEEE